MAIKAIVSDPDITSGGSSFTFEAMFIDTINNVILTSYGDLIYIGTDLVQCTSAELLAAMESKVLAFASSQSYSTTAADIIYSSSLLSRAQATAVTQAKSFTNNASHSFVTTAAAANGFQLSSTRDAVVSYGIQISTTATIGGSASGYVVLEIAATNSSTASDWKEIGRVTNSQTITLALALQSVQVSGGQIMGLVPAGYYARLRSATVSGSPTYTYNSGQEVLV